MIGVPQVLARLRDTSFYVNEDLIWALETPGIFTPAFTHTITPISRSQPQRGDGM